jgi:acetate kinase
VFTAGIGENSARCCASACAAYAAWLGVELDPRANARNGPRISAVAADIRVGHPTNEELMIARHTRRLLTGELR